MVSNPSGLCMCGCGGRTNIAPRTRPEKGWVKGQPLRYIKGHTARLSAEEFTEDPDTGCWLWLRACTGAGYPTIGGRRYAHCAYYEDLVGPIPPGLQLDHLCRTPRCVNPGHLEPVTNAENTRRGRKAKLSHEIARTIRESSDPVPVLAQRYGVAENTIYSVRNGRAWADALALEVAA